MNNLIGVKPPVYLSQFSPALWARPGCKIAHVTGNGHRREYEMANSVSAEAFNTWIQSELGAVTVEHIAPERVQRLDFDTPAAWRRRHAPRTAPVMQIALAF